MVLIGGIGVLSGEGAFVRSESYLRDVRVGFFFFCVCVVRVQCACICVCVGRCS